MSGSDYSEAKEIGEMKALVRTQGNQIQSVVEQMRQSTKAMTELTSEIKHMTDSHNDLKKIVDENKKESDVKFNDIDKRTRQLEMEDYAAQSGRDIVKYIKRAVYLAVVIAILTLLGLKIK